MRWLPLVPLIAAASVGTAQFAGAAPTGGGPRYVLTEDEAFVLHEPRLVAGPSVRAEVWSSDGRYLLVARQDRSETAVGEPVPAGALSLMVWNRETDHARVLWQRPAGVQMVGQLEWLPGTHTALMVLNWLSPSPAQPEPRQTLYWVDAAHGVTRVLGDLQNEQLLVAPSRPRAALVSPEPHALRLLSAGGTLGPAVPLPKNFNVDRWAPDGSGLYGVIWQAPDSPGQPGYPKWYTLDPQTGATTPLPAPPPPAPDKAMPLRLRSTTAALKEQGTTERVRPLWLESSAKSEQPCLLICADSDGGKLAPDASAVAYLSQGAAWVAPLTRMPREQLLAQLREARRVEAISNAKQIGLALMMYAQDYDENFPPPGDGVTNIIHPYVKDDAVFNTPGTGVPGFVYLYPGGSLQSITDPANTEMGYVIGPAGRAMIYADGHVKWRPDEAPPADNPGDTRRRGYFR